MKIKSIDRVQNGRQQEGFDSVLHSVKEDLQSMGVTFEAGVHSRWLWHGAGNAEVLHSIVQNRLAGFAPMLSQRALWGKGTYFARDAAYSVGFAKGCKDDKGFRMLLLCLVEVGLPCVGEPHMVHRPQIHPDRGERYHSFVDSASNPEMWVVDHASQASPAYVVHFC